MLTHLLARIFDHVVYVQIWEERLLVTDIKSDRKFDQQPYIVIEKGDKDGGVVKAVGNEAKSLVNDMDVEVENPFSHPRQLLASFTKAEKILKHAFQQVFANKFLTPAPRVVIHPMEKLEGGLTEIEIRAFRELCVVAGAREVVVYVGAPLLKQSFNFKEVKRLGI